MRFAVFFTLTLLACTSNFSQAYTLAEGSEDLTLLNQAEEIVGRRLRGAVFVNKDKVAKIAGGFLERIRRDTTLTRMAKLAISDDAAVQKAIRSAATAKEKAMLSDKQFSKLYKMISTSVTK